MTTLFAFMLPNRHTYAQAVAKDHRQPFTQATTMENEGRVQGDTKLSSIHFRTEKEDVKWLSNCFIGRVTDAGKVQARQWRRVSYWKGFISFE